MAAADVRVRIMDAVFVLMATTDIPDIRVSDVVRLAGTSRSTFYRNFDSVDGVVKHFEMDLLANMHQINTFALKARFGQAELEPTASMVRRMEVLLARRDKIVALNGPHGDPQFVHKATVLMHEHFRERLAGVLADPVDERRPCAFAQGTWHWGRVIRGVRHGRPRRRLLAWSSRKGIWARRACVRLGSGAAPVGRTDGRLLPCP